MRTASGVVAAVIIGLCLSTQSLAQPPAKPALSGAWTRNADLSDKPEERRDDDARGGGRRGGRGGGFRGGFGGGMGRGERGGSDPQAAARMRDALRDVMNPGDRLTIVETDSMIAITSSEGRTTRLSPDGKKIKDENTNVERRTKWEGGKLVSEISGLGPGTITQTLAVDPESRQMRITVLIEGSRGNQGPRTITHVYDADSR